MTGRRRSKRLLDNVGVVSNSAAVEGPRKRRRITRAGAVRAAGGIVGPDDVVVAPSNYPTRRRNGLPTSHPSNLSESQLSKASAGSQNIALGAQEKKGFERKGVFPFLKLPAELRVHIYRMALQRDEPLMLHLHRPEEMKDIKAEDENEEGVVSQAPQRRRKGPFSGEATNGDAINVALLRTNSLIYKEARQVLYADNIFVLSLTSGIHTLGALHQHSRSLIKAVTLTIPSLHDILNGFSDLVRLGLRYCWGLKKFTIVLDIMFPNDQMPFGGATSVYANAFHILRWLPKGCKVVLEGNVSEIVRRVAVEEGQLLEELDEASYLKRQHQMPERH